MEINFRCGKWQGGGMMKGHGDHPMAGPTPEGVVCLHDGRRVSKDAQSASGR